MLHLILLPLLAYRLPLSVYSSPVASSATGKPVSATALLHLEQQWNDAIVRKDTTFLRQLLSHDFVYIDPAGHVNDKSTVMRAVANPSSVVDPFATEAVQVRLYGTHTAVLTGSFRQSGTWQGQPFAARFRYTDVYVRQGRQWRTVSAQAARLPESTVKE